jgi:hypothetical protein
MTDRDLLLEFVEWMDADMLYDLAGASNNGEKHIPPRFVDRFLSQRPRLVCESITVEEAARGFSMGRSSPIPAESTDPVIREVEAEVRRRLASPAPFVKVTEVEGRLQEPTWDSHGRIEPNTEDAPVCLWKCSPPEAQEGADGMDCKGGPPGHFRITVEFTPKESK